MFAAAAQIALALSALSPPATAGVFVDFDHAAPRMLIESMQREVKSPLEPAGFSRPRTGWRELLEEKLRFAPPDLGRVSRVVRLR